MRCWSRRRLAASRNLAASSGQPRSDRARGDARPRPWGSRRAAPGGCPRSRLQVSRSGASIYSRLIDRARSGAGPRTLAPSPRAFASFAPPLDEAGDGLAPRGDPSMFARYVTLCIIPLAGLGLLGACSSDPEAPSGSTSSGAPRRRQAAEAAKAAAPARAAARAQGVTAVISMCLAVRAWPVARRRPARTPPRNSSSTTSK